MTHGPLPQTREAALTYAQTVDIMDMQIWFLFFALDFTARKSFVYLHRWRNVAWHRKIKRTIRADGKVP